MNGLLVVVLVGGGVAGYLVFFASGSDASSASAVRTAAVSSRDVAEVVTAAGAVQSGYSASASFSGSGTVNSVDVKVGDVVTKGQKLASVDTAQASLQVTIAQNNVNQAYQTLVDAQARGTSTPQQQTNLDSAVLARDAANEALAATTLTAPGDGTVTSVTGKVGDKVGGGSSGSSTPSTGTGTGTAATTSTTASGFAVITDLKNFVLHANVAESDVNKLKNDQTAVVTVNALPGQQVQAKVTNVDLLPTTSNNVVQYGVDLALTSPPAALKPGQSASVEITVASATGVLAVPSASVSTLGAASTVTVLENGAETRKSVEIGVRGDQYVQVTSGLSENDQVVLPQVATGTGTQQQGGTRAGTGFPGTGTGTGNAGVGGGRVGGGTGTGPGR
ncbi:HlyD family efflux transporter periplasmic adaptor subunit [Umezawaea sp. Da 62-37]|uniref:efflux RND transporter periplasmic adaptor subunit n=1 Tax=Umezawaea sp. Da 62-37 TaxID=3075927 RepID=UPI0028F6EB44|nr:HlyD family efflux transporter periplasmic adaptor subunit [Umezawaea sp. Da 62-37]WNV83952.1 HlyD family efflux transporter periplasmic adaptor subunit [Umezawaea sp. Da 62-37]